MCTLPKGHVHIFALRIPHLRHSEIKRWANPIHHQIQVDEEQRPINYTQAFQLLPDGQGSYFIFNDVFRLIFG